MKNILLILTGVFLNAGAQLCMRKGMLIIGEVSLNASLIKAFPAMLKNVYLWGSLLCYGVSAIVWMLVLSRVEVGFAYAFISLGFVIVAVMGVVLFGEHITLLRVAGIVLICGGLFLVAKTA
jgi:multidrug transporter EmrE-like cation transporter